MKKKAFKPISFDIKLAKEITNKKTSGKIVTKDGKEIRIICFNKNDNYYTTALIECSDKNADDHTKEWLCLCCKIM